MKGSTFKSKWISFKISSLEKYQAVPKKRNFERRELFKILLEKAVDRQNSLNLIFVRKTLLKWNCILAAFLVPKTVNHRRPAELTVVLIILMNLLKINSKKEWISRSCKSHRLHFMTSNLLLKKFSSLKHFTSTAGYNALYLKPVLSVFYSLKCFTLAAN